MVNYCIREILNVSETSILFSSTGQTPLALSVNSGTLRTSDRGRVLIPTTFSITLSLVNAIICASLNTATESQRPWRSGMKHGHFLFVVLLSSLLAAGGCSTVPVDQLSHRYVAFDHLGDTHVYVDPAIQVSVRSLQP